MIALGALAFSNVAGETDYALDFPAERTYREVDDIDAATTPLERNEVHLKANCGAAGYVSGDIADFFGLHRTQ